MDTRHGTDRRQQGRRWRTVVSACLALVAFSGLTVAAPAGAQTPAPEAGTSWRSVDAGAIATCAISTTRHLFCWGYDGDGILGNGSPNADSNVPVEVAGGFGDWDTVSVGDATACAIRTNHRLYCWGADRRGSLGNGPGTNSSNVPVEVAGATADWAAVSTLGASVCALKTTGRLFCFGEDDEGQLGNGAPFASAPVPVPVAGGASNWATITAGNEHMCARKTTGRLFCWGRDADGNIGDGRPLQQRTRPTAVAGGATNWGQVGAGYRHSCAVKTTGRLLCWGWNFRGQLGVPGDPITRAAPTEVYGATADWTSVAGGSYTTCGRRVSGRLYCWGDNTYRTLGNPSVTATAYSRPVRVAGGFTDWATVTVGGSQACGIRAGGALYCWGFNYYGQVGNAQTGGYVTAPVPVVG